MHTARRRNIHRSPEEPRPITRASFLNDWLFAKPSRSPRSPVKSSVTSFTRPRLQNYLKRDPVPPAVDGDGTLCLECSLCARVHTYNTCVQICNVFIREFSVSCQAGGKRDFRPIQTTRALHSTTMLAGFRFR